LSPDEAYHLPPDREQQDFQNLLREALGTDLEMDDELAADFQEDQDQDGANQYEDIFGPAQEGEDDPHPFFIPDGLEDEEALDLSHLPPHCSLYMLLFRGFTCSSISHEQHATHYCRFLPAFCFSCHLALTSPLSLCSIATVFSVSTG
jgi:hypothetical protein